MSAEYTSLERRVLKRFKPKHAFGFPPAVVLNDLRDLGDERDLRHTIATLLRRREIRFLRTVPGIWWKPTWCPLADMPLHPTNAMLAGGVARKLGQTPVVSVREAEGIFGLAERYDTPGAPGLVAVPGIERVLRYGVRNGRTIVLAEPVPSWIAELGDGVVQAVTQAFRMHLDLDHASLERLARSAARRVKPDDFLAAIRPKLSEIPAPFDEIVQAMCQEAERVRDRATALPERSAPSGWRPPGDDWSGPTVSGDWHVEEVELDGVWYARITGGRLEGHPYLVSPTPWWHTSPLVWLDLEKGWARTSSRLYRLVGSGADACAKGT